MAVLLSFSWDGLSVRASMYRQVEYHSKSNGGWVLAIVTAVDITTGHVELDSVLGLDSLELHQTPLCCVSYTCAAACADVLVSWQPLSPQTLVGQKDALSSTHDENSGGPTPSHCSKHCRTNGRSTAAQIGGVLRQASVLQYKDMTCH